MESVQQRVAVVTGANRGIGLEISRQLAERGVHVIMTARDVVKGKQAAGVLIERGLPVSFHELDVTSDASVQKLAEDIEKDPGRLDILINNAGVALDRWQPALDIDIEVYRQTLDINVLGPMRCTKWLLPLMKDNGYGRIVNLSSQLGSLQEMGGFTVAYRSSKTALNAQTRVLAEENKHDDILINCMCPGWVRTEMGGDDAPTSPEDAADTAIWLATLPSGGPTGGFFQQRKPYPW